jgi:ATP-dependent 26S proteasome regulatory subunit
MLKPQTDEMVTALHGAMAKALDVMFEEVGPFVNGDAMSAAMYILVDAGMVAVQNGSCSREKVVEDLCKAVRECVMEWEEPHEGSLQ